MLLNLFFYVLNEDALCIERNHMRTFFTSIALLLTIASLINYKKGWKPQSPSLLKYLFQNMANALIEQYKNNRYQCAFDDVKWNNPCSDDQLKIIRDIRKVHYHAIKW